MDTHSNLDSQPRISDDIEKIATRHLDLDLIEEDFMNVTGNDLLTDSNESGSDSDAEAPRVDPRNRKVIIPDLDSEASFPSLGGPKATVGAGWGSRPSNGIKPTISSPIKTQTLVTERFTLALAQSPQVTSQLRETIQKVQKRFSVTVDISSSRLSGTSTFIIKGRPEHVAKAEREIKAGLSPKVTLPESLFLYMR